MKQFLMAFSLLLSFTFMSIAQAAHDPGQDQQAHSRQTEQRPDGHLAWTRDNTHAHVYWEVAPGASQEAVMRLQMMNGNIHKPTDIDATVSVELWMPSMGHGSAPVEIERIPTAQGTAEFRVSKMAFVMSGGWEVRVTLTYPDGTAETATLAVLVP